MKKYIRVGLNLEDSSSNVVLAPSPIPPDEETVAMGGKVFHAFIHSIRCLLSTYYMPGPFLRAGTGWKAIDFGPLLRLMMLFMLYVCLNVENWRVEWE